VITGFNTDIEHDGVVYHVQTEDKGLDTPIILSLVYVGGAILASKRAPYEDLIAKGFSDEALSERLKRQHRLICAAINSGRIDDLKKMSVRAEIHEPAVVPAEQTAPTVESEPVQEEEPVQAKPAEVEQAVPEPASVVSSEFELDEEAEKEDAEEVTISSGVSQFDLELEDIPSQTWSPPEKVEPPPPEPEPTTPAGFDSFDDAYAEGYEDFLEEGLAILLLDEAEFYSGESRMVRVLVVNRKGDEEKPLNSINVSVKILGTTFRPLIYSLKTDRDGVASVATQIPKFTSGRAAVLVRAVARDQAAELRRVIHPLT